MDERVRRLCRDESLEVLEIARSAHLALAGRHDRLATEVRAIERHLMAAGIIAAMALAASVSDSSVIRSGQQFAVWLGLLSRRNSSGGKSWFGHIEDGK